jgi:predicted site-specific integrase-resolvase
MEKHFTPKSFGELIGKSVKTLQRWDREQKLIARRTPTQRRYYTFEQYHSYIGAKLNNDKNIIVYCRVSSANQKNDLNSQKLALEQFCAAKGYCVSDWIMEVGSGLNYKRKQFNQLLEQVELGKISKIIIAHKDRLVRFGFEWFESFCKRHETIIEVMNQHSLSPEQEMTQDLLSIIHCFSSRLYGLRKYKKTIKVMIKEEEICVP